VSPRKSQEIMVFNARKSSLFRRFVVFHHAVVVVTFLEIMVGYGVFETQEEW
jgi:hypothetical protein